MHNGFLNIDNKKMSKSLGNFFTVREIGEKYDLQVLRFFMLSAHYSSPLNFSAELDGGFQERPGAHHNGCCRTLKRAGEARWRADALTEEEAGEWKSSAGAWSQKFEAAMDDDFNTADAVSAIFELVKLANSTANEEQQPRHM